MSDSHSASPAQSCRHFDVIIVSDFSLPGGTTASNVEEVYAQLGAGLTTGLVPLYFNPRAKYRMNPAIQSLIDGRRVALLRHDEQAACEVMIIRHPRILQAKQEVPRITADRIHLIVNQTPKRSYGKGGETVYEIGTCDRRVQEYFCQKPLWHPIGPQIRDTLQKNHANALTNIRLSPSDWVNIIDVSQWRRPGRPAPHDKIRIGRHARDRFEKWPSSKRELLAVYPDAPDYEIRILGGADIPKRIMGGLPANWKVAPYGAQAPRAFLQELDVFVYYIHPNCIEGFGRVIFEAMASGVPVIVPDDYQSLFGEAATYAKPDEVREAIRILMEDGDHYEKQVERALAHVERKFGYSAHLERLSIAKEEA
ncbi:glycosyltransferase [Paenibacillus sp. J5C_2022]|uniref:glycosyltransferase n=1 Tax=Paenibacillus sp. J5C2022 TaxID=2977129 RepID=UPI0021D33AD2|nr:glycosyltransferase [Paenibacillus sp. J5C2022]MCU6710424.1 glycosyltransferase [Paenibacillus sp. J5C2022]